MRDENDTIFIFTYTYPYSAVAESFLDPEISHLASMFDKVILIPRNRARSVELIDRELPSNVIVDGSYIENREHHRSKVWSALRCLTSVDFFKEIMERPAALRRVALIRLFGHLVEAFRVRDWMMNLLTQGSLNLSRTVFYTYWLDGCTHGIGLAKAKYPEIKLISRAHRGDLYEEYQYPPYLPCRIPILKSLDKLFLISEHGERYISSCFPRFADRFVVSRLGVPDAGFIASSSDDGVFRIVSCSYLVAVKRIDLLIKGLAEVGKARPERRFEWIHMGYGPLEDSLKELASSVLTSNVEYHFLGFLLYCGVIEQYRNNPVDVFINVSSSEGIPVSIMEAQNCGIPVIATAVGGTPEIISDEVGILLDENPTPLDIARAILNLVDDPDLLLRKKAKAKGNWRENYDSDKNFAQFALTLSSFHDERL